MQSTQDMRLFLTLMVKSSKVSYQIELSNSFKSGFHITKLNYIIFSNHLFYALFKADISTTKVRQKGSGNKEAFTLSLTPLLEHRLSLSLRFDDSQLDSKT